MSCLKKYSSLLFFFLIVKICSQEYSFSNLTVKDGLPSDIIYDIQQDEIGYLWIATEKGLVKFDGDDFVLINQQKTTTLFIDDKTIYAGVKNGLFVKDSSKEHFFESKKILTIAKHKNQIIIGTIEGIYSFMDNKIQALKINSIIDSACINDIIPTQKGILFSSTKGLYESYKNLKNNYLYEFKSDYFSHIEKSYNSYIAVNSNNEIFEIKNDSLIKITDTFSDITSIKKLKNEIWITSKFNGIEVLALPSFTFKQNINKYNSLQTNCIYNTFRSNNNMIWIASNKGLYIAKKNNIKNSPITKPTIHFEKLQINHQNADSLLRNKNLKLSYLENNIAISFKTVYLSNPKKIQYRYQLNGDFSPWSTNNSVQLVNLKSGKYTLKVQSKVHNIKSNSKVFTFKIKPPFYYEAWFIFSVVIIILVIGYFSLDFYIRRVRKINIEKINTLKLQNHLLSLEQKALQLQMNPHFIFNVLNGIKALGNKGKTQELNTTISKFSILLRGILNNSRKEEISLAEEIILLKNYIELEQKMSSKTFTYTIKSNLNNIDPEEILIPTMLIQPFVENSIQHAFKTNSHGEICINFQIKHRFLHCSIIDNGIGIYQSQKRKGNKTYHKSIALNVCKERLIGINKYSKLTIKEILINKEVKGTKVDFKLPLKTDY